jgi:DNA-binding GntR family transcriptional regulator
MEYVPGSLLVEKVLIEELGIGRTPIREALQRLAIERLGRPHAESAACSCRRSPQRACSRSTSFRALLDGYCRSRSRRAGATREQIDELRLLQSAIGESNRG